MLEIVPDYAAGAVAGLTGALILLLASVFVNVALDVAGVKRWLAYLVGGTLVGWAMGEFVAAEPSQSLVSGAAWPYTALAMAKFVPILRKVLAEAISTGDSGLDDADTPGGAG